MAVQYYNNYDDTMNFSDVTPRMTLTAGVELTVTVPGTALNNYSALFSYASNSNVFVGYNATAAVPANDTVVTVGRVEFKPERRFVVGGDVLHFITPDATAYVGVSFRAISN